MRKVIHKFEQYVTTMGLGGFCLGETREAAY